MAPSQEQKALLDALRAPGGHGREAVSQILNACEHGDAVEQFARIQLALVHAVLHLAEVVERKGAVYP